MAQFIIQVQLHNDKGTIMFTVITFTLTQNQRNTNVKVKKQCGILSLEYLYEHQINLTRYCYYLIMNSDKLITVGDFKSHNNILKGSLQQVIFILVKMST